jgi:hypothetical protein
MGATLPRDGTQVRLRVKRKNGYGNSPVAVLVDGTVTATSERGILIRGTEGKDHVFRARDVLDYTPLVPGQADGPFFSGEDMHHHVRQTGKPPMDMIRNPDPTESSY